MKNMLYKEFRLAMHPTSIIFLSLSAMVLIPNFPYYVLFFYTCLAVFFTCLGGRENHDIFYSMTLPIRKRDIIKSRFLHVVILQLTQILFTIPFALIKNTYNSSENLVGMDVNMAFFGFSFVMLGLFNLVFFTKYYRNTDKVGVSFILGSIVIFIYIIIVEVGAHTIPFFKNFLDTKDPNFLGYKVAVLVAGIAIYTLLTLVSYRKSARSFEALDL